MPSLVLVLALVELRRLLAAALAARQPQAPEPALDVAAAGAAPQHRHWSTRLKAAR